MSATCWSTPPRLWPPAAANTRSPLRPLTDAAKEHVEVEVGELPTPTGDFVAEGFGTSTSGHHEQADALDYEGAAHLVRRSTPQAGLAVSARG